MGRREGHVLTDRQIISTFLDMNYWILKHSLRDTTRSHMVIIVLTKNDLTGNARTNIESRSIIMCFDLCYDLCFDLCNIRNLLLINFFF